jgi:hypothetical protein
MYLGNFSIISDDDYVSELDVGGTTINQDPTIPYYRLIVYNKH